MKATSAEFVGRFGPQRVGNNRIHGFSHAFHPRDLLELAWQALPTGWHDREPCGIMNGMILRTAPHLRFLMGMRRPA